MGHYALLELVVKSVSEVEQILLGDF
jgi:hypothetical protein